MLQRLRSLYFLQLCVISSIYKYIYIYISSTRSNVHFMYFYSTFKYLKYQANLFFCFSSSKRNINLVVFSFFSFNSLISLSLSRAHTHTHIHSRSRSLIPRHFLWIRDPRCPGWWSARNRFRVRFFLLHVVFLFLHLLADRLVQVVEFLGFLARYRVFRFRANERRLNGSIYRPENNMYTIEGEILLLT